MKMCPKCSSNRINSVLIDDTDPKQPIIHCVCENCGTEWVE
jgi:formate dehydrogenase maturation protein FdhE